MGWVVWVLLPGMGNWVSDVKFVSTIDDIAAAHDTQHKQPRDRCSESNQANDMDGVLCRSENRSPGLNASSLTSDSGPRSK